MRDGAHYAAPEAQSLHAVVQGNALSHRDGPKRIRLGRLCWPRTSLYRKRRRRRGGGEGKNLSSAVAPESRNLGIHRTVINRNRRGAAEVRLEATEEQGIKRLSLFRR